jgi:hypothetical protein
VLIGVSSRLADLTAAACGAVKFVKVNIVVTIQSLLYVILEESFFALAQRLK